MSHYFGQALRELRERSDLSLDGFARVVGFNKTTVSKIENGHRLPPPGLAEAIDEYFGVSPLFKLLARDLGGEDTVRRRTLLGCMPLAVGAGAFFGPDLAQVVRQLLDGGELTGLNDLVENYDRRYFVLRDPDLGPDLLAELMIVQQRIKEGQTNDLLRAGARLSLLYGLWESDHSNLAAAHAWYVTASNMAVRSGDPKTEAYVRAYAAGRGVYEGLSVSAAEAAIKRGLELSPGNTVGAMEAYAAQINLAGLIGDYPGGRRAAEKMIDVASNLPVPDHAATPMARAAMYHSYLTCRIGPFAEAERVYRQTSGLFAGVPYWKTDIEVYFGRALVQAGEVDEGVTRALRAVQSGPGAIRVHEIAVLDLVEKVPRGYRSDALAELMTYSSTEPAPWHNLRA